jgi:hypothetical protein
MQGSVGSARWHLALNGPTTYLETTYKIFIPGRPRLLNMVHVLSILMRLLEVAFLVGIAGSAIVVLLSFVEDFGELVQRDDR